MSFSTKIIGDKETSRDISNITKTTRVLDGLSNVFNVRLPFCFVLDRV